MRINILVFLILIAASCSKENRKPILSPDNLESFIIKVNPETDSVFITPNGATLKIEKGIFEKAVTLEIKEAYTIKDMLLGGLVTETNGQPLASGGMIYINTLDRTDITLLKPIQISLPTPYIDAAMMVYTSKSDSINWVQPEPIPDNAITQKLETGKQLFQNNCSSCHNLDINTVAPYLRNFTKRGNWNDRAEIIKWVKNPAYYMAGDPYTKKLHLQWGKLMPSFPQLSASDINSIVNYLVNEENNPYDDIEWEISDTGTLQNLIFSNNICSDTIYFPGNASDSFNFQNETLSSPESQRQSDNSTSTISEETGNLLRNGFTDIQPTSAYVFEIQTMGWYNIDAEISGLPGTILCKLQVNVSNETNAEIIVYVLLPKHKNLSVGERVGNNAFEFNKIDGKIPLFLGEQGLAIAVGSLEDEIFVGSTPFIAKTHQILNINLQKSSKEELIKLIKENEIESIDLDVQEQQMKVLKRDCDSLPVSDIIPSL